MSNFFKPTVKSPYYEQSQMINLKNTVPNVQSSSAMRLYKPQCLIQGNIFYKMYVV